MADIMPELADAAKVTGGGAAVLVLGKVLTWWRGDQEAVLRELRALRESVAALTTKVEVMGANLEHHVGRISRLEVEVAATRADNARLAQDMAGLRADVNATKALVQGLSEGN